MTFLGFQESKERARNLLSAHADDLHRLATALLKYKTLSATEIMQILGKKDVSTYLENTPYHYILLSHICCKFVVYFAGCKVSGRVEDSC